MGRRELLGKINYVAYCGVAERTHDDKELPAWEDLAPKTQASWTAGAEAAVQAARRGEEDVTQR